MKNIKTRPAFFILPRLVSMFSALGLCVYRRAKHVVAFFFSNGQRKQKYGARAFGEIKAALFYFDASLMTASICC